ncbi:MAG: AMP-binding protein, partial [Gammaproteobacteria bacterium]|nr:AMP-binding protein [Gammaproteobacteria bacterium]
MPNQLDPSSPLQTVPAILAWAAQHWSEKAAVVEGDQVTTFNELHQQARSLAKAFIASGFSHGARFSIWAPNSTIWQVIALGGQLAGCVLVPLNTRYKQTEVKDILIRSKSQAVFHIETFLGTDYSAMLASLNGIESVSLVPMSTMDDWVRAGETISDI